MERKNQYREAHIISNHHKHYSWLWEYIIPPTLLSLITGCFYYQSLWYPFQFDDLANIAKNFHLRFYDITRQMFTSSRWIGEFFNALTFKFGRYEPFYYRLTSLGIHLLTGIVVYFLIKDLCRQVRNMPFIYTNSFLISLLTMGLFLLHPVQTQTVSYVIQARLEGLATLFVLTALLLFVKAVRAQSLLLRSVLFTLFFGISFLACGTKEIVIALPFLAVLVDWFFIAEESWLLFKKRLILYALLGGVIIGTLLFYLDTSFLKNVLTLNMQVHNNRGNILTSHAYDTIKAIPFFISQFKVVLHYLGMFAFPFGICAEYDWKLSSGFFAFDAFIPFTLLALLCIIAVYAMIRRKHTFFSFGYFWFLCAVAPRSSIIPSSELVCDYKTYLASVGWFFIAAVLFAYLLDYLVTTYATSQSSQLRSLQGQLAVVFLISTLLGYESMQRNKVWESPIAFWSDIVQKAPQKARGHNNLGVSYAEKGETDKAIACYIKAIELDAYYTDPYNNLAVGYTIKNDVDKAITALNKAIALFPHYPEAYNNRGSLFLRKQQFEMAEKDLQLAIKLRPHYGKAYYNLGRLHYEQQEEEKAWAFFKKATEVDLDDVPPAYHTLGQLSLKLQKFDEAIDIFEKMQALISNQEKYAPLVPATLFNLANAYFMKKQFDKSEEMYKKLVSKYPFEPQYIHNLGETLYTRGDISQALQIFDKARRLPSSLPQTHLRIAHCFEKLQHIDKAKGYLEELLKVNAPDEFKNTLKKEIARMTIQEKVNAGNGTIKMGDIIASALPLVKADSTPQLPTQKENV